MFALLISASKIDQVGEGRYNVGISAIIRIILRDGTFHEDTGYGQCDNTKGKGAALDKVSREYHVAWKMLIRCAYAKGQEGSCHGRR